MAIPWPASRLAIYEVNMEKLRNAWDWYRTQDLATQSMLAGSCTIVLLLVGAMLVSVVTGG